MAINVPDGLVLARGFDWNEVEFKPRCIGEVVKLNYGKSLVESLRKPGNVPMYGTNGQCGWHDRALSEGPGVILGRKGQGHLGVKWCDKPFWVIDTAYYAVVDAREVDLRWFYFMTKYVGLDHLKTGEKPGLPRELFVRQLFPFPELEEQQAIACVLGALDDKLQANLRANQLLEETTSALFRSWFVDFDPVVAKAAGRPPAHLSLAMADLFPDSFQDSELGPIPKGWQVGRIAGLARFVNGRAFTKGASGTGRMVIRIAELNSGPGASTVYNDLHAEPENIAQPGDLLFAWSGSLDVYRWYREEALINQHIFKVLCADFPQWFVHYALREAMPSFQDIAADKATTMGHIKREHLSDAKLALPPAKLITALSRFIEPLYSIHLANDRESQTLAALRDTLLPKLLAGEVRVKEAERLIKAKA